MKRAYQASRSMGIDFGIFREGFVIVHVVCPAYYHRGNGKVERLIKKVNERLRANPEVLAGR